ncbi:MAG: hypothetical protein AAGA50_07090 [Pseudomonadota bacterium]
MPEDLVLSEIVSKHACELDLGNLYYGLVQGFPDDANAPSLPLDVIKRVVADTGWDFKYFKGERFFRNTRVEGDREIFFHVSLTYQMAELITYAKWRGQKAVGGDVWSALANHCLMQRGVDGEHLTHPKPHFSNERQLADLLNRCCNIQRRLSDAILCDPGWSS